MKLKLKAHQSINLRKLANYLKTLPYSYTHFEMNTYATSQDADLTPKEIQFHVDTDLKAIMSIKEGSCKTVCCAAGHGPMAGIKASKFIEWDEYVQNQFGLCADGFRDLLVDAEQIGYRWCFSGEWSDFDNSANSAARRILWLLENRNNLDLIKNMCIAEMNEFYQKFIYRRKITKWVA